MTRRQAGKGSPRSKLAQTETQDGASRPALSERAVTPRRARARWGESEWLIPRSNYPFSARSLPSRNSTAREKLSSAARADRAIPTAEAMPKKRKDRDLQYNLLEERIDGL